MKKSIQFLNNHPLNRSKTKEAHSFSKSPRFYRRVDSGRSASYYDLSKSADFSRPKSATVVFPKSKRFRQDERIKKSIQNDPSPHSYRSPDFIELAVKKKKGITFAQSPKSRKNIQRSPGPGEYNQDRYNPERSPSFFISRDERISKNNWNKVGPGEYQNIDFKISAAPATIGHDRRFKYKLNENPAPGSYIEANQFIQESMLHANAPKFSFGSSKRIGLWLNREAHSPGPGYYNTGFSQFSERSQRIFKILRRL